jgi:hypothetical protein
LSMMRAPLRSVILAPGQRFASSTFTPARCS